MKMIYMFIGFIAIALVQIFVPAKMIWGQEDIIKSGVAYNFETRPIDPSDPFRGKYITLDYTINSFATSDTTYVYGDPIKLYLDKDSLGFAKVSAISKVDTILDANKDYVIAEVTRTYPNVVYFELPFDRFYMEEHKAYKAEQAYRKFNRDTIRKNAYSRVYIKNGKTVLDDVIIDGVSIQEYVEKQTTN